MKKDQAYKRRFRSTKRWKEFRKAMGEKHGVSFISGNKLTKTWQLHHCDLDPEHYEELDDESRFYCLSNNDHKVVHALFVKSKPREWRKRVLRLIRVLKTMEFLNSKK